jgi:hypothetical protein
MVRDISALIGRHFAATSLNVCRISRLDLGAARIMWKTKPSPADIEEFEEWALSIVGKTEVTRSIGLSNEAENLGAWKRRVRAQS